VRELKKIYSNIVVSDLQSETFRIANPEEQNKNSKLQILKNKKSSKKTSPEYSGEVC
jgi:hypothetical protein